MMTIVLLGAGVFWFSAAGTLALALCIAARNAAPGTDQVVQSSHGRQPPAYELTNGCKDLEHL